MSTRTALTPTSIANTEPFRARSDRFTCLLAGTGGAQTRKIELPVVFLASRSRCAWAASSSR